MKTNIKRYRESAGLTQVQLARTLGFKSTSIVSMWETGDRKPQSDMLLSLARILGCTVDELLKDEPERGMRNEEKEG